MRLVALLSARESGHDLRELGMALGRIRFGGQAPIEYQARQALAAGAEALILSFDVPTGELAQVADRLARESDVPVILASDGPSIARQLGSDDRVLMIAERIILPQDALGRLIEAGPPAMLVTPTTPVTEQFERIDGQHVWAGAALLPARMVLDTLDMLGEWDLVLTLLRRLVQGEAHRVELSPDLAAAGQLVLLTDQGQADRALDALSARRALAGRALDTISALSGLIERPLVTELVRRQVDSAHLRLASGVLALGAIAAVTVGWPIVGILAAMLGETALGLASTSAELMLRRRPAPWLRLLVKGASLAVLAIIGGRLANGESLALAGIGTPLVLVALLALQGRGKGKAGHWSLQPRLSTGIALAIGLAGILAGRPVGAFLLIAILAVAAVAVRLLIRDDERL